MACHAAALALVLLHFSAPQIDRRGRFESDNTQIPASSCIIHKKSLRHPLTLPLPTTGCSMENTDRLKQPDDVLSLLEISVAQPLDIGAHVPDVMLTVLPTTRIFRRNDKTPRAKQDSAWAASPPARSQRPSEIARFAGRLRSTGSREGL